MIYCFKVVAAVLKLVIVMVSPEIGRPPAPKGGRGRLHSQHHCYRFVHPAGPMQPHLGVEDWSGVGYNVTRTRDEGNKHLGLCLPHAFPTHRIFINRRNAAVRYNFAYAQWANHYCLANIWGILVQSQRLEHSPFNLPTWVVYHNQYWRRCRRRG